MTRRDDIPWISRAWTVQFETRRFVFGDDGTSRAHYALGGSSRWRSNCACCATAKSAR